MYTVEINYCRCHPETCNCNPWVIKKDGKKFITVFDKQKAEIIVKALNLKGEQMNNKDLERLKEYISLEETELGELISSLLKAYRYEDYMSEKFYIALKLELQDHLRWFDTHCKIIEREIVDKYKVKELEFDE